MDKKTKKDGLLRNNGFQTIIASLLCILIGLLIGYIVLLIINPGGAAKAIVAILKNFLYAMDRVRPCRDRDRGACGRSVRSLKGVF